MFSRRSQNGPAITANDTSHAQPLRQRSDHNNQALYTSSSNDVTKVPVGRHAAAALASRSVSALPAFAEFDYYATSSQDENTLPTTHAYGSSKRTGEIVIKNHALSTKTDDLMTVDLAALYGAGEPLVGHGFKSCETSSNPDPSLSEQALTVSSFDAPAASSSIESSLASSSSSSSTSTSSSSAASSSSVFPSAARPSLSVAASKEEALASAGVDSQTYDLVVNSSQVGVDTEGMTGGPGFVSLLDASAFSIVAGKDSAIDYGKKAALIRKAATNSLELTAQGSTTAESTAGAEKYGTFAKASVDASSSYSSSTQSQFLDSVTPLVPSVEAQLAALRKHVTHRPSLGHVSIGGSVGEGKKSLEEVCEVLYAMKAQEGKRAADPNYINRQQAITTGMREILVRVATVLLHV